MLDGTASSPKANAATGLHEGDPSRPRSPDKSRLFRGWQPPGVVAKNCRLGLTNAPTCAKKKRLGLTNAPSCGKSRPNRACTTGLARC